MDITKVCWKQFVMVGILVLAFIIYWITFYCGKEFFLKPVYFLVIFLIFVCNPPNPQPAYST